ncbi:DUF6924 domain-containing protein [Streptomyces sp. NPDC087844]|uniref:DUF6924 domain-containing protein n=1 Tax=Streptomyces sp. NPDC087844 TaxID=3365805 RepID=UPI0038114DDE
MNELPGGSGVLLVRTHFTDRTAWEQLCAWLRGHVPEGLLVDLRTVDEARFEGMTARQLMTFVPDHADYPCLFVADAVTFAQPTAAARERVLLVVDVDDEGPDGTFRAAASALAEIEANLSPANTDFGDYVEGVDPDGIYRGLGGM